MLAVDKLGLSLHNISEFVEILDVLQISTEEGANVNKLAKFKISGEKSSQKFFRSVKKVNKMEFPKNLPSTSRRDVSPVQSFSSFFLFLHIILFSLLFHNSYLFETNIYIKYIYIYR